MPRADGVEAVLLLADDGGALARERREHALHVLKSRREGRVGAAVMESVLLGAPMLMDWWRW